MSKAYKWLGGIGYILTFVPYANFVASILTAIAWILMGRDTRERIFTIFGAITLTLFAGSLAFVAYLLTMMFAIPTSPPYEPRSFLTPFLGVAMVILGLALASYVLEILAHFKAAKIFDNKWFKIAGWLRIGLIIAAVISIPLALSFIASSIPHIISGSTMPTLFPVIASILWPIAIVAIIGIFAIIFSVIAFFTIPDQPRSKNVYIFEME